jgi:hypothetical protein
VPHSFLGEAVAFSGLPYGKSSGLRRQAMSAPDPVKCLAVVATAGRRVLDRRNRVADPHV